MGLGYNLTSVETPTRLESLKCIKEMSMSESHAVVIDNKGEAYSWGSGKYGELGLERTIYSPFPTKISGDRIFSKVFCSELLTCFIDRDKKFSYYGVIIKIFKGSNSSITLKSLLKDESNSDPYFIFQEKIIYELESEQFTNISIGNGFIGLLSVKGLIYTLDHSDNITILYSKYFVYSLSVSNNQLFGLCRDNNKLKFPNNKNISRQDKDYDLKKSYSANNMFIEVDKNVNYYLCRWVASFFDRDITSDSWATYLYKITENELTENMHLIDSKNKDVLLFFHNTQDNKNKLNCSSNSSLSPVNNKQRLFLENNNRYFDESWDNTTHNNDSPLKKNNIDMIDTSEIFVFVTTFDDSYNMKYKRVKSVNGARAMPNGLTQNRKSSISSVGKGIGINMNMNLNLNKNKYHATQNPNLNFSNHNSNNNSMINHSEINDDLSNLIIKQNIEKLNSTYDRVKLNNNTTENSYLNEKSDLRTSNNELFQFKNNIEDTVPNYNITDQGRHNVETPFDTIGNNYLLNFNYTAGTDGNINMNKIDENILNSNNTMNMSNNENVNYKNKSDMELKLNINSNYSDRERDNLYSPESLVRFYTESAGFAKTKRDKSSENLASSKVHSMHHPNLHSSAYQAENSEPNEIAKKARNGNRFIHHNPAHDASMILSDLEPYSPKEENQNNTIDNNPRNLEKFFQTEDVSIPNQHFNPHKRNTIHSTNKYKFRSSSVVDGDIPDISSHTPKSLNENIFNLNLNNQNTLLKNIEVNDVFYSEVRNNPNMSSCESVQSNYKRKKVSKVMEKDPYNSNPNKDAMLIEDFSSDTNEYSKSNFNNKSPAKLNILTNFHIKSKDNSLNGEEDLASNISNNNSNININEKLNTSNEMWMNHANISISSPGSKYIRNFNKTEKNNKYLVYTFTENEEEVKGGLVFNLHMNQVENSRTSPHRDHKTEKLEKEDNSHSGSISFCSSNNFFKKIAQINTNFNILQGIIKKIFIKKTLITIVTHIKQIDYSITPEKIVEKKYLFFFSKILFRVLTVYLKERRSILYKEIFELAMGYSKFRFRNNLMRKFIIKKSNPMLEKYFNRYKKVLNCSQIFQTLDAIYVKHLSDIFSNFKHFAKIFNIRKKYFKEFFANLESTFYNKKKKVFIYFLYKNYFYNFNKDLIKNKLSNNFFILTNFLRRDGFKTMKINYLSRKLMLKNFIFFVKIIENKILEYKQEFFSLTFLKIRQVELIRALILKKHRVRTYLIRKCFKLIKSFTINQDSNIFINIKFKKVLKIFFYRSKMNLLKVKNFYFIIGIV